MNSDRFMNKVQFAIFLIFGVFAMSSAGWAATYYVDATNGNDYNDGLSSSTAWKTIAKVNTSSFDPDDQILFKRGEIWREQLTVPSSGEPGNTITFSAYGSGSLPLIDGEGVIIDGIVVDNKDYEARTHKYITIQNIHIKNVKRWGIDGINSDHLTVRNCVIEYAYPGDAKNDPGGILLNHNTTYATVENCIIHDVGSGVYIGTSGGKGKEYSSTGIIVRNNEIYNAHSGINIKVLSVDNRVEGNYIHDITTQGIRAGGSENKGNVITRNFIENCAEDGIQLYNRALVTYNIIKSCYNGVIIISKTNPHAYDIDVGDNNIIYNNVIHDHIEGILLHNFYGDIPENNVVKNNIISECSRAIRFSGGAPPGRHGNTFDYNCYYHRNILRFGNPEAITFEQWKAAYGDDSKSLTCNPMFISSNPSKAADFYLQSNSKCVDAGTDVGLTRDFAGNPVPHGVGFDVGSYEYNGPLDSNPPAPPQNLRIRPFY